MIEWIIIGLIVAGSAAVVAVVINWETVRRTLTGKRFAILGARSTGKTTLLHFLAQGQLPERTQPTSSGVKFSGATYKMSELRLDLCKGLDVGGSEFRTDWDLALKDSDIIVYLFKLNEMSDNVTERQNARIMEDAKFIGEYLKTRKSNRPKVFVIGTHSDIDPRAKTKSIESYLDEVSGMLPILKLTHNLGGTDSGRVQILIGSLKSDSSTKALVATLISRILNK